MNQNEVQVQVELLNVCKYETKDEKKPRTMINYRVFAEESKSKSEKVKGYLVNTVYYDGWDVFNIIPEQLCGKVVNFTISKQPSPYDPLRETSKVVKINDINLV